MVSLRTACVPNLRTRKAGGQQPNSIPDLFICAFHECRRRKPHLFPHGHSSWTQEQLQVYLTVAWDKAGPHRQKLYWNPAEGFSNSGQSHSIETEPRVSSDVKRAPRIASRAKGRKAPSKSRTKRTGTFSPPPATQAQPATSPPLDDLEPTSPHTTLHMLFRLGPVATCRELYRFTTARTGRG